MPARPAPSRHAAVLEADAQGDVGHLGQQQRQERVRGRAAEQLDHAGVGAASAGPGSRRERQRDSRAGERPVAAAYS